MFIFASLNKMTLAPFIFWLAWGPLSTAQLTPASLASCHIASHIANSYGAAGGILRFADGKRGKQYDLMTELSSPALWLCSRSSLTHAVLYLSISNSQLVHQGVTLVTQRSFKRTKLCLV